MISEKNFLQTNFGGKNYLQGNTLRKTNSYTEKISFIAYNAGKKFLHSSMSGKKFYL